MERGSIDPASESPATVFVFENLIARLEHPTFFWAAKGIGRWERALDAWTFDHHVLGYMEMLITRYATPIEVITWEPVPFARVLHDRLHDLHVPVRSTTSTSYNVISPRIALDIDVAVVYDPANRFGYGFKARDFTLERIQ